MRDKKWLENRLNMIWEQYFPDVTPQNDVVINFGKRAATRLGSIKQSRRRVRFNDDKKDQPSIITITGYFRDEAIPEYIIDLTIAHELCHYAHGFSSPLPQLAQFPHQGRIVDKELVKRGLGKELRAQNHWLKNEWREIVKGDRPVRRKRAKPKSMLERLLGF